LNNGVIGFRIVAVVIKRVLAFKIRRIGMKKTLVWAVLASLSLLVGYGEARAARLEPVLNIATPISVTVTAEQVERAIMAAGIQLTWKIQKIEPGIMEGSIESRELSAKITIKYDPSQYSITYKESSAGFKYSDGKIHPTYNKWIRNLDKEIQKSILLVK
jgi:hypothetical protein